MPNWCNNGLTLSHKDPAMIRRAVEAYKKGKLLNEFIPVPEDLQITAGFLGDGEAQKELERKTAENVQKYGYGNWYDYCVNEWGTKWDIGDDDGTVNYEEGAGSASFSFDSAWSPPLMAYEKLEAMGFDVEGYYYEPGMGFVGVYRNGYDEGYDLGGETSKTVRDAIGEELDDYWCISENMAEWEAENSDELVEWYEDGVEKKGLEPHN